MAEGNGSASQASRDCGGSSSSGLQQQPDQVFFRPLPSGLTKKERQAYYKTLLDEFKRNHPPPETLHDKRQNEFAPDRNSALAKPPGVAPMRRPNSPRPRTGAEGMLPRPTHLPVVEHAAPPTPENGRHKKQNYVQKGSDGEPNTRYLKLGRGRGRPKTWDTD